MNWSTIIIGSIAGAVALRALLIPSTWAVLGFVALVIFWNFLVTQFKTQKKLINWGMGIFLAIALVTTIGLNLYKGHIKPYTKMSSAATERAKLATDLELALKINPHMLKSRTEIASKIQGLQEYIGERHAAELNGAKVALEKRNITPEQAWKIIFKILEDEKASREKAKNAVSQLSVSLNLGSKPSNGGLAGRLALVGAILFGIALIPKVPIPGKKFWGTIGIVLLVAGMVLWIFPEIQASATTGREEGRTTALPVEHVTESTIKTVELCAGRWMPEQPICPGSGVDFNFEGPPGTLVKFSDGTIGPITKWYPRKNPELRKMQFMGEGGKVEITFSKL